jgi:AcrR family transcriptional regulator
VPSRARREQIISAAVAVIADVGYARASFARIAERVALSSTRFISYHFAGKGELMAAVVSDVVASIADVVGSRIAGQSTAAGMLRVGLLLPLVAVAADVAGVQCAVRLRPLLDAVLRVVFAYTLPPNVVPATATAKFAITSVVLIVVSNAYDVCCGVFDRRSALYRRSVTAVRDQLDGVVPGPPVASSTQMTGRAGSGS